MGRRVGTHRFPPTAGQLRQVPVERDGVVQQVRLPAGTDIVTFEYQPRHWLVASTLSVVSALFLVILLLGTVLRHRGCRGRQRGTHPDITS